MKHTYIHTKWFETPVTYFLRVCGGVWAILLLTLLGFHDIVAFSWRAGWVDRHEKASHTTTVGVGFGWGTSIPCIVFGVSIQREQRFSYKVS